MDARRERPVEFVALADLLTVLANPVRLEMLEILRVSHPLSAIHVRPHRRHRGLSAERNLARPTVLTHLKQLVEKGLVLVDTDDADPRNPRYRVNPGRLYALIEELRALSTIHAGLGVAGDLTATIRGEAKGRSVAGPRLTLVHGVYEGRSYPIVHETAVKGAWTIGRSPECSVALDYDPYVSGQHASIVGKRGGFQLRELEPKNPTRLNWEPMGRGPARLRSGDVIGVGRSLLVWVE